MGHRVVPGTGGAEAPAIYLLNHEGDDAGEALRAIGPLRSSLVVVEVARWDDQLSPWPASSPYGRGGDFAGGAAAFLDELLREVAPAAEEGLGLVPAARGIAGYSLAGLFSLWALMARPDAFDGAASCSGSLWFPGWAEWTGANAPQLDGHVAYLSLGMRESRVKNRQVALVGERTKETHAALVRHGASARLEWNPGGHFTDVPGRMARGIRHLDEALWSLVGST